MTAPAAPAVTARLCDFLRAETPLPEPVRAAGRRTVANALGLAVGASGHQAVAIALDTAMAMDLPGHGSVLGRRERLSLEWAALVNGVAVHAEDFDDTHVPTVIHPGAAVVPAALAMGEWTDATGEELLRATVLGVEVTLRVGQGVSPSHFDRGWHITGTCGHLGAAAAAGYLLGLDRPRLGVALSLAATQASGLLAALGTMTMPLHPGRAAANGVEAALLAERGFTAPALGIEGRRGFARLAAADPDFEVMVGDLGQRWEVLDNAFNPCACGIVAHPAVDAAVELGRRLRGVETDPAPCRDEAYLVAETAPGGVHEVHVPHASGSARRPMTDEQLRHKVVTVAAPVLGRDLARALWGTAMRLGDGPSCRELVAAARPAA